MGASNSAIATGTATGTGPRRLRATDRRRSLLAAATEVFAESNYRAAGVAAIAERAGVSEAILYRHFATKLDLFCEILDRVGRRIVAIWETAIADAPDALAALRRAGEVYFANAREHPAEARLQFQALSEVAEPAVAAVLAANHRRYVEFFADLVRRGRRDGSLRADLDPPAVAWLLNGTGFAATMRGLVDPTTARQAAARDEQVMALLLDSLANHRRRPPAPTRKATR